MVAVTRIGTEFLVNVFGRIGDQGNPTVTGLLNGGFVVAWADYNQTPGDSSGSSIKAQVFDSDGISVGREFLVNMQTDQNPRQPTITHLANGGFVVGWIDRSGTPGNENWGIKAQVFSADGAKVNSEFTVNTLGNYSQWNPTITGLMNGGFVVTWWGFGGSQVNELNIIAQAFAPDGTKAGNEFVVNTETLDVQEEPAITSLANGGFVVTWRDTSRTLGDSSYSSVKAQVFRADGSKVGSEFLVNTNTDYDQRYPAVTGLANGGFVVVWSDYSGTLGDSDIGIKAQVFGADGTKVGSEFLVNMDTANAQFLPKIAALLNGSFVVTWYDNDGSGVKAQVFGADGNKVGSEYLLNNPTGVANDPAITALSNGGFAITWTDYSGTLGDSDGTSIKAQVFTVGNPVDGPAIFTDGGGANATRSIYENTKAVTTVGVVHPGPEVVYSIIGGADAAKFQIDAATGALSFKSAPNFEAPTDVGLNNVYDVIVRAFDGTLADTQAIAVGVVNDNEAPGIISDGAESEAVWTIPENRAAFTTVRAIDPDGGAALTYAITGGADAFKFQINALTGALSFITAPDFDAPTDTGGNNVYDVILEASDGSLTDTQAMAVTVTNVNEAPVITSNGGAAAAAISVAENISAVTKVVAMDQDAGTTLAYSIIGGTDAALFQIDAATGALSFKAAPSFEAPTDAGANNIYDVIMQVSDGSLTDTQSILVTVTDVNEAPAFTSDGGGATAVISVAENTFAVTTVQAADQDAGAKLRYSITGGADMFAFNINAETGALSFKFAPNFEVPTDNGVGNGYANNVFDVIVSVSDDKLTDTQAIAVTITPVNEGPYIVSNGGTDTATWQVAENSRTVTTVVAIEPDSDKFPTYSIVSGTDAALFQIDAVTGALSFKAAPNFEAPRDVGANNTYEVIVAASDGELGDLQTLTVVVTDANDAPVITSNGGGSAATRSVAENTTAVTTVVATDQDAGATRAYSISGGADAAKFQIDAATGALSFRAAPNFEAPSDAGANNVYDVIVRASDGLLTDTQAIAVTVINANEAPIITSNGGGVTAAISVAENATAVTTVVATDQDAGATRAYSISGGADAALFQIDAITGALRFKAAPNFEAPPDAGANNVYDVIVRASDGLLTDTQAIAVTVTDVPYNTVNGTSGNDTLTGTSLDDRLLGLGGDDTLNGLAGEDLLDGGTGNDTMNGGSGDDIYVVDAAGDTVIEAAGGGTDTVLTTLAVYTLSDTLENLTFTDSGAHSGTGNALANALTGGAGSDTLTGGTGADRLIGGAGNDVLIGGLTPQIDAQPADLADDVSGGAGDDVMFGGDGGDTLSGGDGDDDIRGDAGSDIIDGGAGIDLASYRFNDSTTGLTLDYRTFAATRVFTWNDGRGGTDRLTSIETLFLTGGKGNDVIYGSEHTVVGVYGYANGLNGREGNDTITGAADRDVINGGAGDDTLFGAGGNDDLVGDAGTDTIDGGAGVDQALFQLAPGTVGTLRLVEDPANAGKILVQLVNGGVAQDIFRFTTTGVGSARVEGLGTYAWQGIDTVTNCETLRFSVLQGTAASQTLTVNLSVNANEGATPQFADGSVMGDDIQLAALFGNGASNASGGFGNDKIVGSAGNNDISGGGGDDRLIGGGGADTLNGGDGNDQLIGAFNTGFGPQPGDSADVLRGGRGDDLLRGGDGDDQLFGDAGNDNLRGDAGADLLDGGAGLDYAGYFLIAAKAGVVLDLSGFKPGEEFINADPLGGTDTFRNIETLGIGGSNFDDVLKGSLTAVSTRTSSIPIFRNFANQMGGNAGNDTMTGGEGDDYLDGGTGNDTLNGRSGDDKAHYDFAGANEITGAALVTSGVTFSAAALVSTAAATQINAGVLGTDTLTGFEGVFVEGSRFADTLTGSALDDWLVGNEGADRLDGGAGKDIVLYAGVREGYDVVRLDDGSIRVTDLSTGSASEGVDILTNIETLAFNGDTSAVTVGRTSIGMLGRDILTGTTASNTIYGSDGDDILRGGAGNDLLIGGNGNDRFDEFTEAAGDDTINGGNGDDQMVDFVGNNVLRGGDGNDLMGGTGTLYGGAGIDTFIYLASNSSVDTFYGEAGADVFTIIPFDTVFASDRIADFDATSASADLITVNFLVDQMIGWTGSYANVMFSKGYLRFFQTGTDAVLQFDRDGSAGSAYGFVDEVILSNQGGTAIGALQSRVTLYSSSTGGTAGNDTLTGTAGEDPAIRGYGGDDVINGAGGNDFIEGGKGLDLLHGGDGNDVIVGDVIGADTGMADQIIGGNGNDRLFGQGGDDTLGGSSGDVELDGGFGNDSLDGGVGTDIAIFSGLRANYTIERISANTIRVTDLRTTGTVDGVDLVTNIETLRFFDGDVAAVQFGMSVTGTSGIDNLKGSAGNDTMLGLGGNDRLDGLGGSDAMTGGLGNDTYVVDNGGDRIIELAAEGTDTVITSLTYTLATNVENLTLAGSGLTDGTGNALGNVMRGNAAANLLRGLDGMDTLDGKAGADVLEGGLGNDTLTGGTEADAFVFNSKPNSISNMDTVTDFVSGTDTLVFDMTTYTAFTAVGAIGSAAFWSGAGVNAAHDATDRFIYNTTTGALWYDADGTGSAAAVQVATLTGHPALAFGDILIAA